MNAVLAAARTLPDWPRASGPTGVQGTIRCQPEDFEVQEVLGFEPDGAGEHLWLEVGKRGCTTPDAQVMLARAFGVHPRDVAYAGLKDKRAVTTQWFSLPVGMARSAEQLPQLPEPLRVLRAVKNSRKLRRGSHRGNRFVLAVRCVRDAAGQLPALLDRVVHDGVPNYFGPQRFGREGRNLEQLQAWRQGGREPGRSLRGILLSAGRGFLFNEVLAARVARRDWNRLLAGDCMNLDGTSRHFQDSAAMVDELTERLARMDVHPTGPLYGAGDPRVTAQALDLEREVLAPHVETMAFLVGAGLVHDRRALRAVVGNPEYRMTGDTLHLAFTLTAGAYATAVLRELMDVTVGTEGADDGIDVEGD